MQFWDLFTISCMFHECTNKFRVITGWRAKGGYSYAAIDTKDDLVDWFDSGPCISSLWEQAGQCLLDTDPGGPE